MLIDQFNQPLVYFVPLLALAQGLCLPRSG
jgi:hypothetical protein